MKVVGRLLDGQSGEVAASWRSRNGKSSNIRMSQCSILGPILWNILFNGMLEVDMGDGEVIAYSDDAVVVVQGDTRRELKGMLEEMAEKL